ncbi:MAG: hypothetical protein ACSLE6_04895 [Mycobacterium sp.]
MPPFASAAVLPIAAVVGIGHVLAATLWLVGGGRMLKRYSIL